MGPAVYNQLQSILATNVSAEALTGYGVTAVNSLIDQIIALGKDGLSTSGDIGQLASQFSAPLSALLKQQATALLNSPTGQSIAQALAGEAEKLVQDPAMVMLAIVTAGAVAYETDLKLNLAKQQVLDTKLVKISAGGDLGSLKHIVLNSLDVTVTAAIGQFSGTLNVTKTSVTATGKDGGWSGTVTDDFGPGGAGASGKLSYLDGNLNAGASASKGTADAYLWLTSGSLTGTGFTIDSKGNVTTTNGVLKYSRNGLDINANETSSTTGGKTTGDVNANLWLTQGALKGTGFTIDDNGHIITTTGKLAYLKNGVTMNGGLNSTIKGKDFSSDGTFSFLNGGFSFDANGSLQSTNGMSIAKGAFELKDKSLFDLKANLANHGGDASLSGTFKSPTLGTVDYNATGTYANGTFLGTVKLGATQANSKETLTGNVNKDGSSDVGATIDAGKLAIVLDNKADPNKKTDVVSASVTDKLANGTTITGSDLATFNHGKVQNAGTIDVKGKNFDASLKQSNTQTGAANGTSINTENITANLSGTDPAAKASYTASAQYQQQGVQSGGSAVVTYKDPNVNVSNLSYGVTPQGVQTGDFTASAGNNTTHETYQKNGVNSSFTTNVATDQSNPLTATMQSTTTTSQAKPGGAVNTLTTGHAKLAYASGQTNVAVLANMDDKGVLRFTQTGQVDTHSDQPQVSPTGQAEPGTHDLMALTQASFDGSTQHGEIAIRFLENQYIVKGFQYDPVTGQFELKLPQELTKVIQAYVTGNYATPDHQPGSIDKYRLQHLQMLLSSSFSGQWGNFSGYGKCDAVNNEANALADVRLNTGGADGKPNLRMTAYYDYHFDQQKLMSWAAMIGYDQPADGTGWLQQALLEYKYSNAPTMPMDDFAAHVEMAFGKYEVHLQSDVSMRAPNTASASGYVGMPVNQGQSIYVYGGLSYSSGGTAGPAGTSLTVGAQVGGIAAGPTVNLKTGQIGFTLVAPFGGKKKK